MIFVSATIAVNFVCADREEGGQLSGINALITTQEGFQWRMDITVVRTVKLNLPKLV
jgi:hypothetical protein